MKIPTNLYIGSSVNSGLIDYWFNINFDKGYEEWWFVEYDSKTKTCYTYNPDWPWPEVNGK